MATAVSALVNKYCAVNGLESEEEKRFNGKVCLVVKAAEDREDEYAAVLFVNSLGDSDASTVVEIKSAHLTPLHGVEVRRSQVPKAGNGLFATRAFAAGEIVMTETSLLDIPPEARCYSPKAFEEFVHSKTTEAEREVLSQLSHEGPWRLSNLYKVCTAAGESGKWMLRSFVNCVPDCFDERSDDLLLVFPIASRINHSCRGKNVWRTRIGREVIIQAVRPIAEGEEIFIKYPGSPQALLEDYSIPPNCNCALCTGKCREEQILFEDSVEALMMSSETSVQKVASSALDKAKEVARVGNEVVKPAYKKYLDALRANKVQPYTVDAKPYALALASRTLILRDLMDSCTPPSLSTEKDVVLIFDLFRRSWAEVISFCLYRCMGQKTHPVYALQIKEYVRAMKDVVAAFPWLALPPKETIRESVVKSNADAAAAKSEEEDQSKPDVEPRPLDALKPQDEN